MNPSPHDVAENGEVSSGTHAVHTNGRKDDVLDN